MICELRTRGTGLLVMQNPLCTSTLRKLKIPCAMETTVPHIIARAWNSVELIYSILFYSVLFSSDFLYSSQNPSLTPDDLDFKEIIRLLEFDSIELAQIIFLSFLPKCTPRNLSAALVSIWRHTCT